ncbi:type IV secretion system DNA-binding domain-containing protein [Candidatus Peregrinibacteria bacterium]|nr:type IV secretion system DNA-binding domain-containing protein [Candidatus Peregrinibacteria bacterium]
MPQNNEVGPISAEQIFATLHSLPSDEKADFEIANVGGEIVFFVRISVKYQHFIESQIYAQYPDCEIGDGGQTGDGGNFSSCAHGDGGNFSASLTLNFTDIFPIKRYPQFEDRLKRVYIDPIAGISASLLKSGESRAVISVRPIKDKWRTLYIKCLRIYAYNSFMNFDAVAKIFINAFCTRRTIYRFLFFPLYFIFWIIGNRAHLRSRESDSIEEKTSRVHERENKADAAIDKVSRPLFEANIRIFCEPKKVNQIISSFYQFSLPYLNSFKLLRRKIAWRKPARDGAWQTRDSFVLNTEELATIWHLPYSSQSGISVAASRKLEPPAQISAGPEAAILGKTDFRGEQAEFGILPSDRRRHIYILGKTGMGKSTLLMNMIFNDISAGRGIALIDPHGDLADRICGLVPAHRINDVILFDPSDREFPIGLNLFENSNRFAIVASGIISIFKKIYSESWGPRLEYILRNVVLTLLEAPNSTMLWIMRILIDDEFRRSIIYQVADPLLRNFWLQEFEKMPQSRRSEAISPILNKVGQFLSNPLMRNILGQPKTNIDFLFSIDNQKILIINLSKGKIGDDNSNLLGSMLITKFYLDAMSRADIEESARSDFHLYIDEFQNFATDSFADILSEARKYKLNLVIANQYIGQMADSVRDAVFGNVGTCVSFQIGYDDSEAISLQFGEAVNPADLMGLAKYKAYIRLLIDGMPSKVFSMATFPAPQLHADSREKIIRVCREKFTCRREFVEEKIREFASR